MRHNLLTTLILLLFAPYVMSQADQEFTVTDLPDSLKSKANIVVLAKYRRYRGPCMPVRMKGGKMGRRWRMYYGFGIEQVLKGKVTPGIVKINTYSLPKNEANIVSKFEGYQMYWVFINPSEQTRKAFTEKYIRLNHSVTPEEVVAILPAKTE